ncbi:MAG: hypothetical protein IAX21_00360 [Candidatus Bathyarchaeota archaeon]|nr:MAG: hypothetical protein IAX21_00360 [Candidatus Bathyarchaeota archaeon]
MSDSTVSDLQKQITELKLRVDMLEKIVFQLAKEPKKDDRDWVKQI